MKYANEEIVKRVENAKKNKKNLAHIIDKSQLSYDDKFKLNLCKHIVQFANNRRLSLKKISEMTGIPDTRLSEMANYKINKFSVDQLFVNLSILAKHDSQIKAYLELLEQAVEVPMLKVADTRKITRNIRKSSRLSQQTQYVNT